jgi:hypothetical protein
MRVAKTARNVERGVIGLYNRKAGVRAHQESVVAFLHRNVALHLDLVARNANDTHAGGREVLDVFGKFMRLALTCDPDHLWAQAGAVSNLQHNLA